MAASLVAAGIGAAGSIGGALIGARSAERQAKAARDAATLAENRYRADIQQGIDESGALYDQAQGWLAPYMESGQQSANLISDIQGFNGSDAQRNVLSLYQSNPSAMIMGDAQKDAIRRTLGSAAASGLSNAGSTTESLARRLSDMRLNDYYQWQGLGERSRALGLNAASGAANMAMGRGNSILGARSALGRGAASAINTGVNASNAALAGSAQAWGNALGSTTQRLSDAYSSWRNQPQPSYNSSWPATVIR